MLNISKSEPTFFTSAKTKVSLPKVSTAWADSNIASIRGELREYILNSEQKNLCAYCEKSIDASMEKSNIDHFKTRNHFASKTLDYDNLMISCNTHRRCSEYKDKHVKNIDYIHIVNPVLDNPNDFFDYLNTGEIVPKDIDCTKAQFTIDMFNLNNRSLVESRYQIAKALEHTSNLSIEEVFDCFTDYSSFVSIIYTKLKEE